MDLLLFQLQFFRRRQLTEKGFRVDLRGTALLLSRLVPDQHRLRLDRADERLLTPRESYRSAQSDTGGESCDLKNSTLHRTRDWQSSD